VDTGSALVRCAQPYSSGRADGHAADQELLELCRQAVHQYAPLVIFDCRSQVAAKANMMKGGGQEDPRDYASQYCRDGDRSLATVISLDVPNIHEMFSSWQELRTLVERSDVPESRWLQRLGDTQWLEHCHRITEAAVTVARRLASGNQEEPPACVVVHCSDGWDRTSQVCALAQLLVDPRFRTREGFAELVEKDWRRFGYRFADRCATGGSKASPIFMQWLFCVAAVISQFPNEFEFDSYDLMMLADLFLCRGIGTFLFNTEQEARNANAYVDQVSAWSIWLHKPKDGPQPVDSLSAVVSPCMLPRCGVFRAPSRPHQGMAGTTRLLQPVTSLKRFTLWEWALRFDEVAFSRQTAYSKTMADGNMQCLGRHLVTMLRDSGSPECMECKGEFGLLRRRHHCKGCGLLFCSSCVQWRANLRPYVAQTTSGSVGSERTSSDRAPSEKVCRRCFELSRRPL